MAGSDVTKVTEFLWLLVSLKIQAGILSKGTLTATSTTGTG